jgi:hypothetical protein
MNLTNFWSGLKVSINEGINWLYYFLRDNPLYAVALVVLVVVLWIMFKTEVRHK